MSQSLPLSPSLFARLESLRKWQVEQQQRLLGQQSQQSEFLLNEHRRMYEALENNKQHAIKDYVTPTRNENKMSIKTANQILDHFSIEMEDSSRCSSTWANQKNIDEIPIKSPITDFTALLEEKLKIDIPVENKSTTSKRQFLRKGAGLSRFRMTINDLAHKKPRPILPINEKRISPFTKNPVKKKLETSKLSRKSSGNDFIKPKEIGIKDCDHVTTKHRDEIEEISHKVLGSESFFPSSERLAIKKNSNSSNFQLVKNENYPQEIVYSEPKAIWTSVQENEPTNYQALLAEIIEVRQLNPALFDSPASNKPSDSEQQIFETGPEDELKLFEALEQKASNSSFCSTSSLVKRFMEHPIKSTPRKQLDFALLTQGIPEEDHVAEVKELSSSPCLPLKRFVSFSNQPKQYATSFHEETIISSDSESSSDSNSSINSDDVCNVNTIVPTKYKNQITNSSEHKVPSKIFKDAAVNTDEPILNSELLKTRLQQLEKELETFRSENARINKLKSQLETNNRNFDKRKRQLEKDVEEQKKQVKAQLEEEKAKLIKDRAVYDRYAREIKEGKSARQKERDELNLLRSQFKSLQEEIKLKESKWGATQARIRSQLKHLEKDNTTLRTENNELRTKNGKLEATNKQLLSRKPTDTKVLHEINKNLTRLAQEAKEKPEQTDKKRNSNKKEDKKRKLSNLSANRSFPNISTYFDNNDDNKENKRHSLNSTDGSKSSTDHSFESVERQYEKLFGKSLENIENANLPAAEASTCSDTSGKREEIVLEDGSMKITYPNGNVRTISADGKMIVMNYHNGDLKETCKETGTIRYLFADAKTWHTTYPDGVEIIEFANGQIEKRFANGACEIHFPNGCRRSTSPGGTEEVEFPDGSLLLTRNLNGEKVLTLPNGQREIHTKDHKRREYPDGTVKLLYPDGVQETRYANGRIRLKDKQGNLIMDSATV